MAQYAKHLANIMLVSENIEKNLLDKLSEILLKNKILTMKILKTNIQLIVT